ncbi:MAG: oligoendopeptidase F [Pelagibacteraceae bacterium]|nr:oligoendopeptidase F [Pelagibacteraceae bacterium]
MKSINLGRLPTWNLNDIYKGINSQKINKDLLKIKKLSKNFEKEYEGKVKELDPNKLLKAITKIEIIDEMICKILSYAHLLFAEDMQNEKNKIFFQTIKEKVTKYHSSTIFFNLELNLIEEKKMNRYLNSIKLKKYKNWISNSRMFKKHQLSKDLEKILQDKNITSSLAWIRLFDEMMASMRFPFEGKNLLSTEIFNYLSDSNSQKRKNAAQSISLTLKNNINIFTSISNNLAKDKSINDDWRNFNNSVSSRNLSNLVEDEVIDSLSKSVKNYYPKLSHRYYYLKAKWLNKKQLSYWDRNAPLPFYLNKTYSWKEAKEIVIESYGSFSNEMSKIVEIFFEKSWIDAPVRRGKQSGAFSASTVPSVHPYILVNYQGKFRDVSTLAHELGHGIHQYLAAEQGHFNSSTPLTLAETASVFGEMLTFRNLLSKEKDPVNRKAIIANKVEDMLNTVVRQIAFFEFEKELHTRRKLSELTTDNICQIWMKVQSESLGPSIKLQNEYKYYWAYIPHFIHTPFYVYAYAFGDCLVNTLYSKYEKSPKNFEVNYMNLLRAGGSKNYKDLLKPFKLNPSNKLFWKFGLEVINKLITELEELES